MTELLRRVFVWRERRGNDRVPANAINFWAYRQARQRGFTFGDYR